MEMGAQPMWVQVPPSTQEKYMEKNAWAICSDFGCSDDCYGRFLAWGRCKAVSPHRKNQLFMERTHCHVKGGHVQDVLLTKKMCGIKMYHAERAIKDLKAKLTIEEENLTLWTRLQSEVQE